MNCIKRFLFNTIYTFLYWIYGQKIVLLLPSKNSGDYQNIFELYNDKSNDSWFLEDARSSTMHKIYMIAKSRVIVIDQGIYILSFLKIKKNTTCIQCWHSSGLYKKIGFDAIRKNKKEYLELKRILKIHRNIDYFIISDKKLITYYSRAFHIGEDKVLPFGLCRTDKLYRQDVDKIREKIKKVYGLKKNKRLVLYAPTFRTSFSTRVNKCFIDIKKLIVELGDKFYFAYRCHPSVCFRDIPEEWIDFSAVPLSECLATTDLLITDYSSILFDFAFYKRPIILFVKDIDEYKETQRELYVEPEQLVQNMVCKNEEELIEILGNNKLEPCNIWENFMSACDGHSTERLVKFINNIS